MASIKLNQASVDFPVFGNSSRSITSDIVRFATGGSFGKDKRGVVTVEALKDISLSLKDGDRLGLLGHNGAGKSTLLRMLGKIYAPTRGEISIEGNVGSLIDISLGINPEATGKENIFLRGALLGIKREQISKLYDEICDFTGLGEFINLPVRTYSSGMHLRLAFAVATVITPDILLMDEWLSVGDEGFRVKSEQRLNDLVDATKIIVLASHSRHLIEQTCNKAIWLEHGEIKMQGSAFEVCNEYFGTIS